MPITDMFASGNLPNLVFIITDQQRNLQHYPDDFIGQLPAMLQLMKNGLWFPNAHTAACMCSPSRATFLTSNYPAVTGVTATGSPEPASALPPASEFPNLASVLLAAGYAPENVAWRGKWHLGNTPNDYGFSGWTPPDAGNWLGTSPASMQSLGGGTADNDGANFLPEALSFLSDPARSQAPFALVISFVNPHDVYVGQFDQYDRNLSGYDDSAFTSVTVDIPTNANEDLSTKPRAQSGQSWIPDTATQQSYVNFYAYLQTLVDGQIQQILNQLTASNLTNSTLVVRFADHGEMGLSHSLVEKFYNAYEETTNIPLIFSNPNLWPTGATATTLASSLDLVPTFASLLGVSDQFSGFKGCDLTPVLINPSLTLDTQLHFTYDDAPGPGPSTVRNIRTSTYSYSVYFVDDGSDADWEMYDLGADPLENNNVAGTTEYGVIQETLDAALVGLMAANGTAPSFAWPPKQTADSVGGPPAVGANVAANALAQEITTLVPSGNASVDRLAQIMYDGTTPPHVVVRAARGLAAIDTRESFSALQDALYGSPTWPKSVTSQVHAAMAERRKGEKPARGTS